MLKLTFALPNGTTTEPLRSHADKETGEHKRTFKSGSRGYFIGGKTEIDGKRYQVSCTVVEIGSKPEPGETRTASGALVSAE